MILEKVKATYLLTQFNLSITATLEIEESGRYREV